MTYRTMLVYLLLLGYSLCWVSGNESPANRARSTLSEQEARGEVEEDSAMTKLLNVTTLAEFFSLLVRPDGTDVTEDEVYSNFTDDNGVLHINSGGRMALPDECSPRESTVRLVFDNSNPNVVYFPRCTKIEKCGGCCASSHLECVPSYTERVTYRVVKAVAPYPGSSHLEWKGEFSSVILERHVNCRVQCTLTPDKCGPKKEFMDRQCECKCRVYERCQPPRVWDPEECECKCAEVLNCCKNGESCGLIFKKETCECGVETNVELISNSNFTQQEIDAYFEMLNNTSNTTTQSSSSLSPSPSSPAAGPGGPHSLSPSFLSSSPTPPTPEATTTTTTAQTTTTSSPASDADPCPTVNCPVGFIKQVYPDGNCSCRRVLTRSRNRNSF